LEDFLTLEKSLFRAYVPPTSFVRKIHPITKIVIIIVLNIVILSAKDIYSTIFLFLISIILVLISRSPLSAIKRFLYTVTGIILLLSLTYIFLTQHPGNIVLFEKKLLLLSTSGGDWVWHILISDKTVIDAFSMALRLLTLFFAMAFFMVTTNDRDIIYGLRKLKMPYAASLTISLIFRAISLFIDDFFVIRDAMKSKGADFEKGTIFKRIKNYIYMMIPLFISIVRKSEEISMAIESRGIPIRKSGRTTYHTLPFKNYDWLLIGIFLFILIMSLILQNFSKISIGYPLELLVKKLLGG
jgi:energy-coupling factor transport system permease protein